MDTQIEQNRLEGLVAELFAGCRVEELRPRVEAITDRLLDLFLLDDLMAYGSGDLVAELAAPLSTAVLCELVGVRGGGPDDLARCAEALAPDDVAAALLVLREGHDATVRLIGTAAGALLADPERVERLRRRPERLAVELDELVAAGAGLDATGPPWATGPLVRLAAESAIGALVARCRTLALVNGQGTLPVRFTTA